MPVETVADEAICNTALWRLLVSDDYGKAKRFIRFVVIKKPDRTLGPVDHSEEVVREADLIGDARPSLYYLRLCIELVADDPERLDRLLIQRG